MRRHLSRNGYRRLLHGTAPWLPPAPNCMNATSRTLRRPRLTTSAHRHRRDPPHASFSLFGLFSNAPREVKDPNLAPGYPVLLRFRGSEREGVRPPPRGELLAGLRAFLEYKADAAKNLDRGLTDLQAGVAHDALKYLLESTAVIAMDGIALQDLILTQIVLSHSRPGDKEDHAKLAKLVYQEIKRRVEPVVSGDEPDFRVKGEYCCLDETGEVRTPGSMYEFDTHIRHLAMFGAAVEAAELLAAATSKLSQPTTPVSFITGLRALWKNVLQGLAREGNETWLLRIWEQIEKQGCPYTRWHHRNMVSFFASRDRVAETKLWHDKAKRRNGMGESSVEYGHAVWELMTFALRNNEKMWMDREMQDLWSSSNGNQDCFDASLAWDILGKGHGADQVKQRMKERQRQRRMLKSSALDLSSGDRTEQRTMNRLFTAANLRKDPYLVERLSTIGGELGIPLNGFGRLLLMMSRLEANDLSGAQQQYEMLQNGEYTFDRGQDLAVFNKYVRALSASEEPDVDRILHLLADLEQRQTPDADTLVAVCMALLRADRAHDVIDTLSMHGLELNFDERARLISAFIAYILDSRHSTARVWDAYQLLRQFFPELDPDDRARLMDGFFARKRPDLAVFAFGHMRAHPDTSYHPTADMYVRCLEGLGRFADEESVRIVHNMLKMDTRMRIDTRLRNALMIAHLGIERGAQQAEEFWDEVAASAEGPSLRSLSIVLKIYAQLPYGDRKARGIWQKVRDLDLDVPVEVFNWYCGAIANKGNLREVQRLIQGMGASVGAEPTAATLGITYNCLPDKGRREDFENWAEEAYPDQWAKLLAKGRKMTVYGPQFNIDMHLQA